MLADRGQHIRMNQEWHLTDQFYYFARMTSFVIPMFTLLGLQ